MPKIRLLEGGRIAFQCPGCGEIHAVPATSPIIEPRPGYPGPPRGSGWQWNGNFDSPTIKPSLKTTSGHLAPGFKKGDPCWCNYTARNNGEEAPFKCECCHVVVTNGHASFCVDSTHALSGKTVPLPEWSVGSEA